MPKKDVYDQKEIYFLKQKTEIDMFILKKCSKSFKIQNMSRNEATKTENVDCNEFKQVISEL